MTGLQREEHEKMEFTTNNNRWNTTRKKYILSLKNRIQNKIDDVPMLNKNNANNRGLFEEKSNSETTKSEDSQNFSLRLSDSIIIDDTIDNSKCTKSEQKNEEKKESEIIIISDSSDDDCENIIEQNNKNTLPLKAKAPYSESSPTFNSVDISEIWTDDESKKAILNNKNAEIDLPRIDMKKHSLITSDESIIDSNNIDNDKNNISNTEFTTPSNQLISLCDKGTPKTIQSKQMPNNNKIISIGSSTSKKYTANVNKQHDGFCDTPNSAKFAIRTTPLSKKDARDIARAINSKRAMYNSPSQWQRQKEICDTDSETSDTNPKISEEIQSDRKKLNHPAWIDETDSETGDTTQDNLQVLSKPSKTHVSRFLDPVLPGDTSVTLPDNKKEEISRWLLSNANDTRSDTSASYVPPSEQNSLNSGNSSLDRLELQYETPNNRDKFKSKIYTDNSKTKISSKTKTDIKSAKTRQTTMDSFLRKVKRNDKDISYYTPISTIKTKKKVVSPLFPDKETELQVADCADILDKLYGDIWRDKADDLLPKSESRKINPKLKDRAVQTEIKKKVKSKKNGSSFLIPDKNHLICDDFKTFVDNIKPNFNSTKKLEVKNTKRRDSFINDNSITSESDGNTTFQTAMTTPLISNLKNLQKKETPMSALTIKAIEICDSDTEDDEINIPRRKLSFSDDEIDLSPATSEYDPDDVIPPKSVIKSTKTSEKILIKPSTKTGLTKSFLASLSASVPLENAHPDAKKYRMNYKNSKDHLCKYLYKLYNEKIFDNKLPDDMLIEWNVRMRGTAGFCYNKTKKKTLGTVERSSRLVLATKILDAPDRLRDTLVHEMCHAATWLINEVSDGHGPFWQAWASKAMKAFPELPSIKRCHDYKISTKYTYRCIGCGYSIGRHSKSLDVERKRCGHCFGKFELLINKTTKSGTVQVKTPINRKPTGFALFVKENYNVIKKERRDVGHKEVMQILGQQFSAIKISNKNNNVEN